ncbi:hypothetical protein CMQ_869 [Grosmannia clavigera kw1407]|uniref:Uncharacterized protein n=1 Tax=Grosmannia clavigera (strain kw1407 / UAMH 11150) TaxID=655863 RepID=F0XDI1_GROCL|nr:uncharacterized protein CMQ_869 [Grosmannia clavigera kw1407]EFX03941.1 hypothetical protein CMQ_869 [Grosmannia clavigera kw1407]
MLSTFQGTTSGLMHTPHTPSFGENYDHFSAYGESTAPDATSHSNMEYNSFLNPNPAYYPTGRPLPQPHHPYDQQQQQQQQQSPHGLPTTSIPSMSQMHAGQQHQSSMPQHALPIIGHTHAQPPQFRASRGGTSLQGYRDPTTLHPVYQSQTPSTSAKRVRQTPTASTHSTLSLDGSVSDVQSTPRSIGSDMRAYMVSGSGNAGTFGTTRSGSDANVSTSSATASRVNVSPELFASVTTDQPSLVLSERASEEDRYLFELHEQFKGTRGKGMWDAITSQYAERYPGSQATACLQMKFTRCFRRFILWPKDELECLLEAWREDEAQRFARITTLMKERGGGKKHDWKPADIEMILVRLELEEADMDEFTKIRRRRRRTRQRKSSAPSIASQPHHAEVAPVMTASTWSGGFSPAGLTHPQYSLPPPQQDNVNYSHYDEDDHSEVNSQLDRKYYSDSSASPGQDDIRMLDGTVAGNAGAAVVSTGTASENLIQLPPPTSISSASMQNAPPYGPLTLSPHTERVSQSSYEQLNNRRMSSDPYRP